MSLVNYPTIRPSLILDFQKAEAVDPRITFTRATTATRFNSYGVLESVAANVPRIDFDPSTLVSRGLLIEEQRTNLEPNSEALTSVTGASILNNVTTAPSGLVTADKLVEDTSTGGHQVNTISIVWVGNTAYTFTIFLKADTRTQVNLAFGTAGNWVGSQRSAQFDLSNGTIIGTGGANVTASIESVGNGWYRCRITCTTIATPVPSTVQTQMWVGGAATYTGNGTSGLFFWGAQVEVGSFPTSYIPTSGTTLTRNADVASMTGTNFSSWYNASEGTLFGQYQTLTAGTTQFLAAITSVSEADRITVGQTTTAYVASVVDTSVSQASITQGTTSLNSAKIVFTYKINDFAFSLNGAAPGTDTVGTVPAGVTEMKIGRRGTSTSPLNGWVARLAYYPTRLPNATLQALTA